MELLRELMRLQHERGWLDNDTLRALSKQRNVPLYQLEGLVSFYPHFRRSSPPQFCLHVCRDVSCAMQGGSDLLQALRAMLAGRTDVELREVSCLGRCDSAPAAAFNDVNLVREPNPGSDIVLRAIESALADNANTGNASTTGNRSSWKCNPYRSSDDWFTTVRSLATKPTYLPETCIKILKDAGLRGMGGAGFPTGRKWELVRGEPATPKYVICNADESEPGTFKDRVILAELSHLVVEGMVLAGLTVGAECGIVYLRHEYAPEQLALESAIAEARRRGILGENAAGSGRRFDIEIFVSPGGYILGEETALLEALEDKRGEPRNKPPYPGTHGLWGQPTLINNVETFALATTIIHHGADWWRSQGQAGFSGLKFVSVSGDIKRPGVYEIPIGMTVRELIELAGGMLEGTVLQAFLPGGASSNFLPADKVDTPLDFDAMKAVGSMLGTGAVIVISDRHDLFALATNIVRFFRNESCGKCVPCRMGTEKTVGLLEQIQMGEADISELPALVELGQTLEQTSICGLGQVALNPILSWMRATRSLSE